MIVTSAHPLSLCALGWQRDAFDEFITLLDELSLARHVLGDARPRKSIPGIHVACPFTPNNAAGPTQSCDTDQAASQNHN